MASSLLCNSFNSKLEKQHRLLSKDTNKLNSVLFKRKVWGASIGCSIMTNISSRRLNTYCSLFIQDNLRSTDEGKQHVFTEMYVTCRAEGLETVHDVHYE